MYPHDSIDMFNWYVLNFKCSCFTLKIKIRMACVKSQKEFPTSWTPIKDMNQKSRGQLILGSEESSENKQEQL